MVKGRLWFSLKDIRDSEKALNSTEDEDEDGHGGVFVYSVALASHLARLNLASWGSNLTSWLAFFVLHSRSRT